MNYCTNCKHYAKGWPWWGECTNCRNMAKFERRGKEMETPIKNDVMAANYVVLGANGKIKDSGNRREWNGEYNHCGDKRGCSITHGLTKTKLYECWCGMKKRCYNPKDKRFSNYGARGIQVCDEWRNDFQAFYNWSMENGYSENLTIDRINVNDDYKPSNCRWTTRKVQANNTTRNHYVTAFGKTKTISEWSEIFGVKQDVIKDRLNKLHWNAEEAVSLKTLPVGGKRNV